jgi:hypothetical protein
VGEKWPDHLEFVAKTARPRAAAVTRALDNSKSNELSVVPIFRNGSPKAAG